MKLQKLISKLEKHHKKKLDLSLGRTFNLLKKLGDPQNKLKNVITVVGTNAKASMLALALVPTTVITFFNLFCGSPSFFNRLKVLPSDKSSFFL